MLNRFITRIQNYAVKHLKNGAARVYIKNTEALQAAGFLKNTNIRITYLKNGIDIHVDQNGSNKVMDTGRGELVELKNKDTGKALANTAKVSVTFRKGVLRIRVHGLDAAQQSRVSRVINTLKQGKPLRTACFFSGLGMLSYHVKEGLKRAGVATEITFANDVDELAMSCNLEGNPMWLNASEDALAVTDSLDALHLYDLPQVDVATIGYPCVGQSILADKEKRDLMHPLVGTLFMPLFTALRKMNPAIIVIENTPRFAASQTLDLLMRALPDYQFEQRVMDGHDYNEIESRKRVAIVATTKGLPALKLDNVPSLFNDAPVRTLRDIQDDIPLDAPCWREMQHVKARDNMAHLGYRNALYFGDETTMTTLPASYGPPKAGVPMFAHPINDKLQRQVMPNEHAALRELPDGLKKCINDVWNGIHALVSKRGSFSAAHRLCGNGVSKRIWQSVGASLGQQMQAWRYA